MQDTINLNVYRFESKGCLVTPPYIAAMPTVIIIREAKYSASLSYDAEWLLACGGDVLVVLFEFHRAWCDNACMKFFEYILAKACWAGIHMV